MDKQEINSVKLSRFLITSLKRQFPENEITEEVQDLFLLLVYELLNGNLYINLKAYKPLIKLKAKGWPKEHLIHLKRSDWINGKSAIIVLDDDNLSLKRWSNEMSTTIEMIIEKGMLNSTQENTKERLYQLNSINCLNKAQQSAVNSIQNHGVVLLSGGPGTGKTSTIIHMLEQVFYSEPDIKIGLAAPTGKATKRLQDSLLNNLSKLDSDKKDKISRIPCKTLHKWLKANYFGFGRNKSSPLNIDLLVIDEMSMVDLALMQGLLEALPKKSKLVLVGDPNQLPPIGSGAIWKELQQEAILKKFGKGAVHLDKVYRNRGAIASLSRILNEGELDRFWEKASMQKESSNVRLIASNTNKLPTKAIHKLEKQRIELKTKVELLMKEIRKNRELGITETLQSNVLKSQIFDYLENLMVLSPKKSGPWGVYHIHRTLLGHCFEEGAVGWPEATPIMCSENQQDLGLSNGDIGIIVGNGENRRFLFKILSEENQLIYELIHPARVKKIEPAFALTIHKAQGSESNQVILLWPNSIKDLSNDTNLSKTQEIHKKRMLYTAITRAKEKLDINIPNN